MKFGASHSFRIIGFVVCFVYCIATTHCSGQFTDWVGDGAQFGDWSQASHWTAGVPTQVMTARIGNVDSTELRVDLDVDATVNALEISNGMALDLNAFDLTTLEYTLLSGGMMTEQGLLRVEDGTFTAHDVTVAGNGRLSIVGGTAIVDGLLSLESGGALPDGQLSGSGLLALNRNGSVAMINNGLIRPASSGLTISQAGAGLIDLDGSGEGVIDLQDNIHSGYNLTVFGTELLDSFSGVINFGDGSVLDIDLANGWTADLASEINFFGNDNSIQAAVIQGSDFTLAGHVNVLRNPSTDADAFAVIGADTEVAESAQVFIDSGSRLGFAGVTTITGGQFNLDQGASLNFADLTTIQGGSFTTLSNDADDGIIRFQGQTIWDGEVNINGFATQIGDAIVSGVTVIDAETFDMDGINIHTWEINNSLTVNADAIDQLTGFDGTFTVGTGATSRLNINLNDPLMPWNMDGDLNVANNLPFEQTKLGGSPMQLNGSLNVDGANVRFAADTTFADGSTTTFETAASSLVMRGNTVIENEAMFVGEGTVNNHPDGRMMLADGVSLNEAGLINRGLLEIGDSPGIADAASFDNAANSRWLVEIGGHIAGDEHDQLLIGGGDADLNGRLVVKLIEADGGLFTPQVGDEFTILTSVSPLTGQFVDEPISIAGGNGYQWEVLYNSNDVTLRLEDVIPDMFLGDVNGDGGVNLLDVQSFVQAITGGLYNVLVDINCDGVVDLLDVQPFVDLLTG